MRWYTTGDVRADVPLATYLRSGPEAQFNAHTNRNGPIPAHRPDLGPCWVWQRAVTNGGYGLISIRNRTVVAYKWAYEHFVGPIPEGLEPDHLCRNRACVNYERHLELVTHRVNVLRSESPFAHFARQTHCINGHEFTPENTFKRGANGRGCRECNRIRCREKYQRRKSGPGQALIAL